MDKAASILVLVLRILPYFSFGFSNYNLAITTMCTHLCVMATHTARVTRVTVKVIVGGFRIRPRINNEGCVVHCNSLASKDVFTNGREGGGAGSSAVLKSTILRVCLRNPSKLFVVHLQIIRQNAEKKFMHKSKISEM